MFQECFKDVSRLFQKFFKGALREFKGVSVKFWEISRVIKGCFNYITKIFHGYVKSISMAFQGTFKNISRKF